RAAWRRRVGLVLQEVSLFPGTFQDNLTVFDATRAAADVERACGIVGADALLRRLPQGLATPIAERGANLSMGERQLVSLARALVHDPDLLVLDEATSAIDPRTEALLQESLTRLLAGRTALIVAHRLATVRRCDEILVVEHGRIVERGTHAALLAAGAGADALVLLTDVPAVVVGTLLAGVVMFLRVPPGRPVPLPAEEGVGRLEEIDAE
ncbi:MAG: ATP-binding cassette domain-containing protein, partial [Gammaproteobacteria bacterium]